MRKLESYRGKTVVITGASSGIGKAMAYSCAAQGARVALVSRRCDELRAIADEINAKGGEALTVPCDVGRKETVFQSVELILEHFGSIDILVNNAGYGGKRPFSEWPIEDIEKMMRTNYLGAVYWTKAVLPYFLEKKSGWLVFISSVAGKIGVPGESAYCASKFAMAGLAESLSMELEDDGIHVLTVCPATVKTPFFGEEALRLMPEVARNMMIEPEVLVRSIDKALKRGKREITVPSKIGVAYWVRALVPEIVHRSTKRTARPK